MFSLNRKAVLPHVCFIHATSDIGGAEKQSLVLARLLHTKGYPVSVAVFRGTQPLQELCRSSAIPFYTLNFDWEASRWQRILGLVKLVIQLRKIAPTILMPYCDLPNLYCGRIWKWTGAKKLVWNQRGVDTHCLRSRLTQRSLKNASAIISNSLYRKEILAKDFDIPASRITVVYNAVTNARSNATPQEIRESLGLDPTTFVVCMIANYVPRKRHDLLLRAWANFLEMPCERERCLLLLGHKYEYFEELKQLATQLALGPEHLLMLDFKNFSADYLAASDISIFTGDQEGLPNAILEAMAMEKAVIAVDDPSNREALGEAPKEFLTFGSPEQIAEALYWSLSHPEAVRAEAQRNKRRADELFTEERLLNETIRAIGEC